jgi:uncharacterized membrane protein YfcA
MGRPAIVKTEEPSRLLLLLGFPLGVVCGLLGLSGTEHRAPILRAFFRGSEERVAPLNLLISVMTLGGAIIGRDSTTSAAMLGPLLPELLALTAGTIGGVYAAGRLAGRISKRTVQRWTLSALVVIGAALAGLALASAAAIPVRLPGLPSALAARVPAGVVLGVLIGAVSSVRSISGGELLIPALVLAFGADIRIAGSASACLSFPIVLVALGRAARAHAFEREHEYRSIVVPMGVGSALGAIAGGHLLALVPAPALMILLGGVLILSAVTSFQDRLEAG